MRCNDDMYSFIKTELLSVVNLYLSVTKLDGSNFQKVNVIYEET